MRFKSVIIVSSVFLLVPILNSCYYPGNFKKPKKSDKIDFTEIYDYSINKDVRTLNGIRVERNNRNGTYVFKYIEYDHLDSSISTAEFSYAHDLKNETFDFSWYKHHRNENESIFMFNHTKWDSINKIYYELDYSNDSLSKRSKNVVITTQSLPNHEITRKFKISNQVVSHYKNEMKKYADSLSYFEPPTIPNLSNSNELLSSRHEYIEYLTDDSTETKTIIIDSLLVNGSFKVDTMTQHQYYKKSISVDGLTKEISRNPVGDQYEVYWKREYYNPQILLSIDHYEINSRSRDTIFHMEMKTKQSGDSIIKHFVMEGIPYAKRNGPKKPYYVNTHPPPKKGEIDYRMNSEFTMREMEDHRLPIVYRDVKIYSNKLNHTVKMHCLAKTDQGHDLEYKYHFDKGQAIIDVDKRTVKEVSTDQIYDLVQNGGYVYYNYVAPAQKLKLKFRPFQIFKKGRTLEMYNKGTKTIKRDRKNKIVYREYKTAYSSTVYKIHFK